MKFFKIYVCVSLFIIILLLAVLVGAIMYAGTKVKSESTNVTNKVNTFNQSINDINTSLQKINQQLQTENSKITQSVPTL